MILNIYRPSNSTSVIARTPPERVAKILLLLCAARSRFSPVDVSSIVVPVRIIVIILYIFIRIYKSFPTPPPTLQSLNPIYRLFMAPRLFRDAAPTAVV